MKLDELKSQMAQVREAAGAEIEMAPEDVDGDFDPAAHDARMAAMFNDDYYEGDEEDVGEGEWEAGDGKRPTWAAVDDVLPPDTTRDDGGDDDYDGAGAGDASAAGGAAEEGINVEDVRTVCGRRCGLADACGATR